MSYCFERVFCLLGKSGLLCKTYCLGKGDGTVYTCMDFPLVLNLFLVQCVCSKLGKTPSLRLQVQLHLGQVNGCYVVKRKKEKKKVVNENQLGGDTGQTLCRFHFAAVRLHKDLAVLACDTFASASGKQPSHR